ncbi:hypothetical protein SO802_033777 [Lithocarpus litseifolius]|uniref:Uncharacterized protein n=1 Tax=Lithocarpus litseifolius TaxID=425828 RepID=A0AAW2BEQ6_9ROSI
MAMELVDWPDLAPARDRRQQQRQQAEGGWKNAKAGAYKNIAIDNWEDIEILGERDRATGIGVEHMNDAIEVTTEEGENEVISPIAQQPCQYSLSTSSATEPHKIKKE